MRRFPGQKQLQKWWRPGPLSIRRKVYERLAASFHADDLVTLATIFQTDKWNSHWYAQHYARHFEPLRFRTLNLLEIGVGGYADPNDGGNSLRMWKAYFPHSMVYGLDVYDKTALEEDRIRIVQGRQDDKALLRRLATESGGLDIVIDDGSHINAHVITAFETLFPLMRDQGMYVVEDTQTSYWPDYGGSSTDVNHPATTMGYFKRLVDGLNHQELLQSDAAPSYFDRHIVGLQFYHNLIFILKGDNHEPSGLPPIKEGSASVSTVLNSEVQRRVSPGPAGPRPSNPSATSATRSFRRSRETGAARLTGDVALDMGLNSGYNLDPKEVR